jgi:hypothetical protein
MPLARVGEIALSHERSWLGSPLLMIVGATGAACAATYA